MFDLAAQQQTQPQAAMMFGLSGFGALGTITRNSSRDRIKLLQKQLNYYAGANLAIDGVLGQKTWQAVIDWEYATNVPFANLSENFVVSDYTLNTLGIDTNDRGNNNSGGTQPGGGGNTQPNGGGARVSFEWKAPAVVSGVQTWGTAQTAFGAAMTSAGFDVQYNSYEYNFSGGWTLVVRGLSPIGLTERNSISNRLLTLAENAGFNVATGDVTISTGEITRTGNAGGNGANNNPNAQKSFFDSIQEFFDKKFGFLGGTVSGAALLAIGVGVFFFLKRD